MDIWPSEYDSYESAKREAKEFYRTIGTVWCPVLNEYIVFNQKGFKHLMGNKNAIRPRSEQKRRFDLFRHIRVILEDPQATMFHAVRYTKNLTADFWTFIKFIDGIRVKIVIRQVGKGRKHFFSIYGKKQKSTQ